MAIELWPSDLHLKVYAGLSVIYCCQTDSTTPSLNRQLQLNSSGTYLWLHVRQPLRVLLMDESSLFLFPPADDVHEFPRLGDLLLVIEGSGEGLRASRVDSRRTLFTVSGAAVGRQNLRLQIFLVLSVIFRMRRGYRIWR